jgi:uncharacterized protein (DUF58 family)
METDFLAKLDKLSLLIRKNVTSNYSGDRKSQAQGQGLLFKDYTMYTSGDDIRHVDWKVYARTDKLFIKRFEEERNLTVHILVDFSGSMGFTSHKMLKSTYAAQLAVGFAYLAMKNNERFVLSAFSKKLTSFRPRRGRGQLIGMFDMLKNRKAQGVAAFEAIITRYKSLINSKALVFIVSDFLYDLKEIESVLQKLNKQDVRLVQVLDPVEMDLNIEGDYRLEDLETSGVMKTYVSPVLRKKYLSLLQEHNKQIKKFCNETGATFHSCSTDTAPFQSIYDAIKN